MSRSNHRPQALDGALLGCGAQPGPSYGLPAVARGRRPETDPKIRGIGGLLCSFAKFGAKKPQKPKKRSRYSIHSFFYFFSSLLISYILYFYNFYF